MPQLGRTPLAPERQYEKCCPRCQVTKPLNQFFKTGRATLGHARDVSAYCKPCAVQVGKEQRARNPHVYLGYRIRRNLKKYGMTPESYEEMLIAQGRRCAICGTTEPGGRSNMNGEVRFKVDHDHTTGAVRGLLCGLCNSGLGHFRDDVAVMARAIAYIEESKEK